MKKIYLSKVGMLFLLLLVALSASAKKSIFTVKQGEPLVLLQEKKKAVCEIDYSKLIIVDKKDADNNMDFATWMQAQDEDNDKWTTDWETKDKADCDKAFREHFNDEVKNGITLSKLGKDYKVVLHFLTIDFGPAAKMKLTGFSGGEATASGELEVRDFNTDEIVLILSFNDLKGESSFKQIGRLKGLFENLGEELSDFLKDYQKAAKKGKK